MSDSSPISSSAAYAHGSLPPEASTEAIRWNSVVSHILKKKKPPAGFTAGKRTAYERAKPGPHFSELPRELRFIQEQERRRIAAELQTGIGQTLDIVKFGLEDIQSLFAEDTLKDVNVLLQLLDRKIHEAISELARITTDLRPSSLEEVGLLPAISWLLREFQETHPEIEQELNVGIQESDIPDTLKTPIYGMLQEALQSIARQARTSRISIHLYRYHDSIELVIKDYGNGSDDGQSPPRDHGLIHVCERAVAVSGGNYQISTQPGQMSLVQVIWPVHSLPLAETSLSSPYTRRMFG